MAGGGGVASGPLGTVSLLEYLRGQVERGMLLVGSSGGGSSGSSSGSGSGGVAIAAFLSSHRKPCASSGIPTRMALNTTTNTSSSSSATEVATAATEGTISAAVTTTTTATANTGDNN